MTRKCTKCEMDKDETEFAKRTKSVDGLNRWCRACVSSYDRKYHKQRDQAALKAKADANKKWMADRVKRINELKSRPCADCKTQYHPAAMQFDHLSDKAFTIATNRTKSWESIVAEIAKCEVVCANCHAVRSWSRQKNKTLK